MLYNMNKYKLFHYLLIIIDFFKNHYIIIIVDQFLFSWIKSNFIWGYIIVTGYTIIYLYLTNCTYFHKKICFINWNLKISNKWWNDQLPYVIYKTKLIYLLYVENMPTNLTNKIYLQKLSNIAILDSEGIKSYEKKKK